VTTKAKSTRADRNALEIEFMQLLILALGAQPVYVYPDGATAWADVPFDAVHVAN
jgi:hypothetical protein